MNADYCPIHNTNSPDKDRPRKSKPDKVRPVKARFRNTPPTRVCECDFEVPCDHPEDQQDWRGAMRFCFVCNEDIPYKLESVPDPMENTNE